MSTDPDPEVLFFGSYDAELHPRVATLRQGLSATHRVTELNAPLGLSTADKIDAASSVRGAAALAVAIARSWKLLVTRARRSRPSPDLVVVGYMGHFDVHLARLLWPDAVIVLDHLVGLADTSRDRGLAGGAKSRLLDLLDRAAFRRADVVVVDTVEQFEQLPSRVRGRAVVVPVGATEEWFQDLPPSAAPPVRVCFVGVYTPLHGAPVIGEAIGLLADDEHIHFTMVGDGQERALTERAAAANPRVEWVDWVQSEDLPGFVASHHVGLGIFGVTPKAQRVVPTKVYQGLAAGNVVVTSDTDPQRRMLGDAALFVPAGDPQALAECLRRTADRIIAADDPAGVRAPDSDRFSARFVVEELVGSWRAVSERSAPERRRIRRQRAR